MIAGGNRKQGVFLDEKDFKQFLTYVLNRHICLCELFQSALWGGGAPFSRALQGNPM